jgi:hypothetical protein
MASSERFDNGQRDNSGGQQHRRFVEHRNQAGECALRPDANFA